MLKHITVCAMLFVLATSPLRAQQQEAALQQIELPAAGFNIVLATPKSPAATINLGNSPDALIAYLAGGELALGFDDADNMLAAIDALRHPACTFRTNSNDGKSTKPVAVYVVPAQQTPGNIRTASPDIRLPPPGMRKVEIPGNNFDIVYTTTETPIAWDAHERPDPIAVLSTGYELLMMTNGDIEKMFKDVGLSQWPTCVFYVERKGSHPSQAATVYLVPEGDITASATR